MDGTRRRPRRHELGRLLSSPGVGYCAIATFCIFLLVLLRPAVRPLTLTTRTRWGHVTNAVAHLSTKTDIELPAEQELNIDSAAQLSERNGIPDPHPDLASVHEGAKLPQAWGSCHIWGSKTHLCKIKDVFYEGKSIVTHWQAGAVLPFLVRDVGDGDQEAENYTMPGPCTEYTALSPGCQENSIFLQAVQANQYQQHCAEAVNYVDPVVLVYRNFYNVGHMSYDQLAPFYLTLFEFGLTEVPVQILFMDEDRYMDHHVRPGQIVERDAVWSHIAGRKAQQWGPVINASFCAAWAILGSLDNLLAQPDTYLPLPEILGSKARYSGFAAWLLNKYAVTHEQMLDSNDPTIVIEVRAGSATRRILNEDELLSIGKRYSGKTTLASFSTMGLRDQLAVIAHTDVYVAVHGAALAWAAFLPPWAVVVELKPYAYNVPMDFFYGYCTWARLFSISHLSWHNRNASASIADQNAAERWYVKDFHTHIDAGNASWIIESALNLTMTPLQDRAMNECADLNKPATFEEFGEPIGFSPFEPVAATNDTDGAGSNESEDDKEGDQDSGRVLL